MQTRIVGRFRRRSDAEGHLYVLKRLLPNVPFEIMFDITPEHTEDLTPQPPSLQGKGEDESSSPLLAGEGLEHECDSPLLAGYALPRSFLTGERSHK